jgi:hypothetical protein
MVSDAGDASTLVCERELLCPRCDMHIRIPQGLSVKGYDNRAPRLRGIHDDCLELIRPRAHRRYHVCTGVKELPSQSAPRQSIVVAM